MAFILSRPRLLARAARAGANLYRRERDLSRLLPGFPIQRGRGYLIKALTHAEAACEVERTEGGEAYSLHRHIGLLSALFAETKTARG